MGQLATLYYEYVVVQECKERWLAKLRPWLRQLGSVAFRDSYGALHDMPCVYAIVSQLTGRMYVGTTCNFQQRVFQHVHNATSWRRGTQAVHTFMQHFGAHRFVVVPLVGPLPCELSRTCIERKLIRMLCPALNVEHAPPARQVLASGLIASSGVRQHGDGGRRLIRQRPPSSSVIPSYVKDRYVTYTTAAQEFHSLDTALHAVAAAGADSCIVVVSAGMVTLNSRDVLRLQYGSSDVSVVDFFDHKVLATGTLKKCLPAMAPPLLHGVVLLVHKLRVSPPLLEDMHYFLKRWSRDASFVRLLYYCESWDLVRLYKAAKAWHSPVQRRSFRQRIAYVFHQRHGFPLQHRPVLTLPYLGPLSSLVTHAAKLLLQFVLQEALSFMPLGFRQHFIGRSRVVVRRGMSVEDMFINYRQFAAAFDPKHPFECMCKHYRGFPKVKGHVCCRADDPRWPASVPTVSVHGKYVPHQPVHITTEHMVEQLASVACGFGSLSYDGAICSALWQALPAIASVLQQRARNTPGAEIPPEHQLEHLQSARTFLQDLVCLQLDRNLHCLVFQCPRLFWENMMALYVQDPHYQQVPISEDLLLAGLRMEWRARGWHKIAPLYSGARVASAYYIPKNKDVCKNRPIIPSRHHPLRNVYSISSRGLSFVLEVADFEHFNLPATTGMKKWLEGVNAEMQSMDPVPVAVAVHGHDVKQMYTDMVHRRCIAALYWIVQLVEQQHGGVVLSVKRRGRGGVRWGRNANSRTYATVTLQQLVDIARYELEHAIFRVGSVFLWQQIGLAMGGFNSPPLAVITCAVDEYHWLRSLSADARLVRGMRYVDDSTLAILASASVAEPIVQSYRTSCYSGGLVLESTGDCSAGELEILECMVSVGPSGLSMRHRNRNQQSLEQHAEQLAFMKVVPFDSAVPVSALRNIVVGLLHRVEMNTSGNEWHPVVQALHLSQLEFVRMGYPKAFLVDCLHKALPSLLKRNSRWLLASAVFSFAVGCQWRPWHSLR
jgi:hypothetical protein